MSILNMVGLMRRISLHEKQGKRSEEDFTKCIECMKKQYKLEEFVITNLVVVRILDIFVSRKLYT